LKVTELQEQLAWAQRNYEEIKEGSGKMRKILEQKMEEVKALKTSSDRHKSLYDKEKASAKDVKDFLEEQLDTAEGKVD
jgi:hypothetical protein